MSIHRTRKGAEIAMEFHKEAARKEWERLYTTNRINPLFPFGENEAWEVFEEEILD